VRGVKLLLRHIDEHIIMPTDQNIINDKLAIILLAAGASVRLGQSKQLVDINGQSLLARQGVMALSLTKKTYCVLGCAVDVHHQVIKNKPIKIVVNDHWQEGMATSIAAGAKALPSDVEAVMIILVDQWQLTANHIEKVAKLWMQFPEYIIAANHNSLKAKQMAPPVIFPKKFFAQLSELKGNTGAKSILTKYHQWIKTIEIPEAFVDLDTPEQLAAMRSSL
jgi:molybdenum cofactor cytidylyltransferase